MSYDLFVRGHSNAVDIKIAKKIAKLLNRPLHILESRAFNEFTQDGFFDLLQRLDGSYMPLSGFQLLEAYEARYSSNAAYNIGGLGGEYYKTSILSLPYHSISDSYVLRILKRKRCCLSLSEIDDVLYSRYYDYDRNLIKDLSLTDNSKAYLDWYREQFFPRNAGVFYGVSTKYIPAYPPLAESIFYKWICSLPFKLKVFKLFYRKIIMRENRALANLETSFGFSLSMSPIKFLKDLFITFILIIRRIISRFILKNLYITSSIQVSDATDMLKLKTSVFFEEVSDFLQKEKILSSTKRLSDMPLKKIDRFLVLWFWLHKLNNDS
ncbi:hypothetical protein [Treponema pedis]|uniref:Uncharacterized protein n=1 Tax=Treponema pedis TaxID=409322 RepID=A0A7S6WR21_9SPIR|nr:hypothetical protein [Treponema pedis]QOW61725.1 hypothetical protein IFE08_04960 [Treponema pedis]